MTSKIDFENFERISRNWTRAHNHSVRKRTLKYLAI